MDQGCGVDRFGTQFLAAGKVITPSPWTSRLPAAVPPTFETDTLKYLGVLGPTNHVAGISTTAKPVNISFSLPTGATSARLLFGGMVMSSSKPMTALVLLMRVEDGNTWAVQQLKVRADQPLIPVEARGRFGA